PGGVQTNFFVVTGKTLNVCGNGVLDVGEQCDPAGGAGCCSAGCTLVPADTPCDDGNVCTTNGVCDGVSPACPVTGSIPGPCDDGNACTLVDVCVDGVCVGGAPVSCRAQDQCHVPGVCDAATGLCSNP